MVSGSPARIWFRNSGITDPLEAITFPYLVPQNTVPLSRNIRALATMHFSINAFDIQPFLVVLINPADYTPQYPACSAALADLNLNGTVNQFDIQPFIDLLIE